MEITVRYFTVLREITGKREEKIDLADGSILEDAVRLITRKYGRGFETYVSSGRRRKGLQILFLIDGQNAAGLRGFKTGLRDGSTLIIMPPVAGG
jgi:MoaD family protein